MELSQFRNHPLSSSVLHRCSPTSIPIRTGKRPIKRNAAFVPCRCLLSTSSDAIEGRRTLMGCLTVLQVRYYDLKIGSGAEAIDISRDYDDVNLAIYVSQKANSGLVTEVVDKQLLGDEPSVQVMSSLKAFSELALGCLRERKGERPSMTDVVQELKCITQMIKQEEACNDINVVTV